MRTKDTQKYFVLVEPKTIKQTSEFGTWQLRIVTHRDENGRERIRNCGSDHRFDDLVFACQWDTRHQTDVTYGWDIRYVDLYSVDRQLAERILGVLKSTEKASAKFPVQPASFGQFVALHAAALGCIGGYRESRDSDPTYDFDARSFSFVSIQELGQAIDWAIEKAREAKAA